MAELIGPGTRADGQFREWYQRAIDDATVRFMPLAEELERLLEVKTEVNQTGGMVMCLRVPIGRELAPDGSGGTARWAWFAELGSGDDISVGLYHATDEDDFPEGELIEWPGDFRCGGPEQRCAWYHHPVLARQVARWAAPIIAEFAAETAL